jgi:poly(hydroxyalkanoate) granule-associated protein
MAKAKDTAKTLKERGAALEAQSRDMAQKIWFAGLGAYGRAYTEAAENAKKMNAGTTELFEDLVKRGTQIDSEMKARLSTNETVSKAAQSVSKVTETAMRVQREQREAFEARMQRMRAVLGFKADGKKADDLSSKIDQLEDEIAELAAKAKPSKAKGKASVNKDVATRLARLSSEIDAIAKINAPKKRKTTTKKTTTKRKPATAKKTTTRARTQKAKAS